MDAGGQHLAAGLAAALVLPLGVFGLHLPFPAGLGVAALVYAGVALAMTPRRAVERINFATIGRAQAELVAELLEEGEKTLTRLKTASRGLRSAAAARTTAHLAEVGRAILDRLAAEPSKLAAVRRFLTYYLPRSVEIAEGLAVVEGQRVADPRRQAEIEAVLEKLDQAFTFYADGLSQADLDTLDVELKLIGRALAEDLGSAGVRATAAAKERP